MPLFYVRSCKLNLKNLNEFIIKTNCLFMKQHKKLTKQKYNNQQDSKIIKRKIIIK